MKYCSKCGNELFDETVICPKCGCPVGSGTANQKTGGKKHGKQRKGLGIFLLVLFGLLGTIFALNIPISLMFGVSIISPLMHLAAVAPGIYAGIILISPKRTAGKKTVWGLIIASIVLLFLVPGTFEDNVNIDNNNISNIDEKEVELTADNIDSYLSMNFSYSEMKEESIIIDTVYLTDVVLNTYPTIGGTFNNVTITVSILLESNMGWEVNPNDNAAKTSGDGYLSFSFRLPADGDHTESHKIQSIFGVILNDDISYKITDVSGTFTKN